MCKIMVVIENIFSEKFVDDLVKFGMWLDENEYYLNDIVTGENIKLEINLMNFKEPSRNKLECYVKELLKYYSLVKYNEEIDDIKSMIKDFRQNKPKKTIKKKNEIKKKEKDIVVKEDIVIKDIDVKEDIVIKDIINLDTDRDTENACNIDTLEFSTKDLEKIFGKPLKNGKEHDKHQYEWKILVVTEKEEVIYSIYNWMDKNGNFNSYNENEWYIATMKRCLNDKSEACECQLSFIIKFIKDKLEKLNRNDMCVENGKQETKESIIMQLFNLTDIKTEIIDIDDICF